MLPTLGPPNKMQKPPNLFETCPKKLFISPNWQKVLPNNFKNSSYTGSSKKVSCWCSDYYFIWQILFQKGLYTKFASYKTDKMRAFWASPSPDRLGSLHPAPVPPSSDNECASTASEFHCVSNSLAATRLRCPASSFGPEKTTYSHASLITAPSPSVFSGDRECFTHNGPGPL